jgi:L-rhamnose-H+ transport protein
MIPNPAIGVVYHWLGGLASASFYVPYRGVRRWSWEIFWLTGGVFSWLLAPWLFAAIQTHNLLGVMAQVPRATALLCILFGILWGFGGLTYGLTMRYLGLSLGMAVVLGLCTVFGTLLPPLVTGNFTATLIHPRAGRIVLLGIALTLLGIIVVARAGQQKDAELTAAQKSATVAEFNFRRGIGVAVFSGIMSSCFAFGLTAGAPVKLLSAAAGTGPLWTGLPTLCLVMFGGLLTNAAWCAWLIARNKSAGEWLGRPAADGHKAPLLRNLLLCALAGTAWYFQFFFYTMGQSQMGRLDFSSWTLHMASIIIFGTLWGFAFHEWKDAAPRDRVMVWAGVGLLVIATIVIGYGNMIAAAGGA